MEFYDIFRVNEASCLLVLDTNVFYCYHFQSFSNTDFPDVLSLLQQCW